MRQTRELLGVKIPQLLIPVGPGRDIVNVLETAAMDYRLKRLGHDASKELDQKIIGLLSGRKGRPSE
jgi:HPr kinase/phosphorylase